MVNVRGSIEKVTIGQKKEGDLEIPTLTLTVTVPIKGEQTVSDIYSVFQEQVNISFGAVQGSLNLKNVEVS